MTHCYEVAIIGGGVVGCASFRALSTRGISTLLLEKNESVISGASAGNSGIFHTGFDAPRSSLEFYCMKEGHNQLMQFQQAMKQRYNLTLPMDKCGALVIAWNEEELKQLPEILKKAKDNQCNTVRMVSTKELQELEPNLNFDREPLGAVLIEEECIVDPAILPMIYLEQGLQNSKSAMETNAKVINILFDAKNKTWMITVQRGQKEETRYAKVIVNCAGNYGDYIEKMNPNMKLDFEIVPRKGQFLVYDKKASQQFKRILLPVPTERTKGVLISRTVHGNVIVGPTATDQEDREKAETDEKTLEELKQKGVSILPALKECPIIGKYAGLRPAARRSNEYQVGMHADNEAGRYWITVGAIRSTGLTSSLGIGELVWKLLYYHYLHKIPVSSQGWEEYFVNNQDQQVEKQIYPVSKELTTAVSLDNLLNSKEAMDPLQVKVNGKLMRVKHPLYFYGVKSLFNQVELKSNL